MKNIQASDLDKMSSIWLRPLRFLIERGSQLPPTRVLVSGNEAIGMHPFGAIAKTRRDRLIFWPAFSAGDSIYRDNGEPSTVDHVTLEIANDCIHSTAFNEANDRRHHRNGWALHDIPADGLAWWFNYFVKWDSLAAQDKQIELSIRSPTSDVDRRKAVLTRYVQNLRVDDIPLAADRLGDYLLVSAYITLTDSPAITMKSFFLNGVDEHVSGWPDGSQFPVQAKIIDVGELKVVFAVSSPQGSLINDMIFTFPAGTGTPA